ncbi:MAG: phage holin family protein [Chitinivibrionales bacterium]
MGYVKTTNNRSFIQLFKDLRDETATLVRDEIALVKTEVKEKIATMGKSAAFMFAGAAFAYTGLIILLIGLSVLAAFGLRRAGLSVWMAAWIGPVGTSVIVFTISAILVFSGVREVKKQK